MLQIGSLNTARNRTESACSMTSEMIGGISNTSTLLPLPAPPGQRAKRNDIFSPDAS